MPVPLAALVAAGNFAQGQQNAQAQSVQNEQSQRYADMAYQRQRADALEFWGMQNEYNSPAKQMERFQAAGLNPHLIYGQGNSGNASSISVPDAQMPQFKAPVNTGFSDAIAGLLSQADLRIKNAQAKNLETQTDVIVQDAALRAYQAERAGFDLAFEKEMLPFSADARREAVRATRINTDVLLKRDAREASLNASSIEEAFERMESMREQRFNTILNRKMTYAEIRRAQAETQRIRQTIENMKKDGTIKDWEVKLSQQGLRPGDPLWVRQISEWMGEVFGAGVGEIQSWFDRKK